MARKYGDPVSIQVVLSNPKQTMVLGNHILEVKDDNGKVVGSMTYALGGAIRVTVDEEDYDLHCRNLWDALVKAIGKEQYLFSKT